MTLFDVEPVDPRPPRRTPPSAPSRPVWVKVGTRVPPRCDDCPSVALEDWQGGKAAMDLVRSAYWRRTVAGETRFLCTGHAQQQRKDDEA